MYLKDLYSQKENLSNIERVWLKAIREYEHNNGICPFQRLKNPPSKSNPLENLKLLMPLYDFTVKLGRDKFIDATKVMIRQNYNHYKALESNEHKHISEHWKSEWNGMLRQLQKEGVTSNVKGVLEDETKII